MDQLVLFGQKNKKGSSEIFSNNNHHIKESIEDRSLY